MGRRTGGVVVLAAVLSLSIASTAGGATRYAAPGGTGSDPCANPARPCSVYTAADKNAPRTTLRPGDVVELAPGTYRAEEEGEFGYIPPVLLPEGVTVRGEPGKPRPVIVVAEKGDSYSAFQVPPATIVADVEIRNYHETNGSAIEIWGGTINRVIARSVKRTTGFSNTFACSFYSGVVRSSACISSGGGSAIGVNNLSTKGVLKGVIRNSVLIATGPESVGMDFSFSAFKRGLTVSIDAVGVIARGEERDVIANALALNKGRGTDLSISLRSSDYATVAMEAKQGGTVSVTAPGTNGNIRALPLLAADNLHQLPGSPTIDRGGVDAASDPFDVDGQPRSIGVAPDIGADEFTEEPARVDPAPSTVLGTHPPARTGQRESVITFGSNEIGSRYECRLDHGPYRTCASPFVQTVGLGKHRFEVRAIDPEGKVDKTPAASRWQVLPCPNCF